MLILFANEYKNARQVVRLLVGLYMLIYFGIIRSENMQIEGFWYYLFTVVIEAATIHYTFVKISGPLFFGRGWCGYACWTAMVLDFFPYKIPNQNKRKISWIRYIVFLLSLLFVAGLFLVDVANVEGIMFWAFIIGNAFYYIVGIALAFLFKNNRAFCKYICPITVFMKPMSCFSLLKIKCDTSKCVSCDLCKKVCPMDVDVTDNTRKREHGTECILCMECLKNCQRMLYENMEVGETLKSSRRSRRNKRLEPVKSFAKMVKAHFNGILRYFSTRLTSGVIMVSTAAFN